MIISVIGLMFGDEGKGNTVAALTKKHNATANIRFSGGSQAAHRVVSKGISHIFAQIGSGSAVSNTIKTYLTDQMAIDPLNLVNEISIHHENGLNNLFDRIFIDHDAPIITEYHKLINRLRELNRLDNRVSTTGLGVGEVHSDVKNNKTILKASDLLNEDLLYKKLYLIEKEKFNEMETFHNVTIPYLNLGIVANNLFNSGIVLRKCINYSFKQLLSVELRNGVSILEGSQGTLLDQNFGTKPYITHANVSLHEAIRLLNRYSIKDKLLNLGVTRAYTVRHGLGPLPSEDKELTALLPDSNNKFNEWQREFRCGWLDIDLLKYSLNCNQFIDGIVVTNTDRLPDESFIFENNEKYLIYQICDLFSVIEQRTNTEILGMSYSENIENFIDI